MLQGQNAIRDWAHPHWPWGSHQAFSEVGWRYHGSVSRAHATEKASRIARAHKQDAWYVARVAIRSCTRVSVPEIIEKQSSQIYFWEGMSRPVGRVN